MQSVLLISNAVLLLLLVEAGRRILRYRSRLMELEGTFDSPIPVLKLDEFHELFAQNGLGQGLSLESEVSFVGGGVLGGASHFETWVLSVLAKRATTLFEFGTGTGRTTYLWAKNSAPDARVITLALGNNQHADYQAARGDNPFALRAALTESVFDRFLYSGTPAEHKVTQLFGDSKRFDETPYLNQCDLIFIDGSHAYSYVKNDTEKALRMLREGGVLLWHDYRYRNRETSGVRRYLDELSETMPLVRLHETAFVVYRKG
jgi:predicted O-methyltransferase YrrM